jgi:SOS response regulatory protein OraA/RecX
MTPDQMPQFTPEQGQQAQAEIQRLLQEAQMPPAILVEIGNWAQRVIQDPSQFPAFQAWLQSQGLDAEDIPQEPDYQELMAMVSMGHVAQSMESTPAKPTAESVAPVSPEQLQGLAQQGTYGDTQLAHINPQEAAVLQSMGGTGTINPNTGLPQYGFFSDLWKGIKKVAKAVAPFVLPVVAIAFPALIPAVGSALGASAALAPVVGAAAISGATTALAGGSLKDVIGSAALTGLGAYLAPVVGNYVGDKLGVTSASLKSVIGSATFSGGLAAVRGGSVSDILKAAATGAAGNYLGQLASNAINSGKITNTKITQKTFDDAVFAAADAKGLADAGLKESAIRQVLESTGLSTQVANDAAAAAAAGRSADDIAISLSNRYGGAKAAGSKSPSLYNNDRSGVTQSVIGGGNVKGLESVQRAEDALLAAQDAKNIKATLDSQGIRGDRAIATIQQNLQASGVQADVARYVAQSVVNNPTTTIEGIANGVTTNFSTAQVFGEPTAVTTTRGTLQPREWNSGAQLTQNQQDANFIAQQIKDLSSQGLSQQQIINTLTQEGVSEQAIRAGIGYQRQDVNTIAAQIERANITTPLIGERPVAAPTAPTSQTMTQQAIAPGQTEPSGPITTTNFAVAPVNAYPGGMTAEQYADFEFAAADAAQLKAQGLGTNQISQTLQAAGVNPGIANQMAFYANQGATVEAIARTTAGQYGTSRPVFAPPAPAPAPAPTTPEPAPAPVGGNVTEAEFVAADAAQLKAQGLSQSQIESTLLYSGVDPLIAADAAQLAASGYDADTIAQNITQSGTVTTPGGGTDVQIFNPPGTPVQPALPGYQGPVGSEPGTATTPTVGAGTAPAEPEAPALTPEQVGTIIAADQAAQAGATPAVPQRPDMGTFTPAPPDPSWSRPLQYPGLNPGLMGAAIQPAYATTSPVQSQYYWGRQPFMAYESDLARYNQVPMPNQPWGIQQGYFEQPSQFQQMPTYGQNLQPLSPQQTQAMPAAAYGEPLAQPLPVFQPVMPYMNTQSIMPVAPTYIDPNQQDYVYNIAPQRSQYSIPSAAPVA